MIRALLLLASSVLAMVSHAEVMRCDSSTECSLVCFFPSTSTRTEHVYPANGVVVDRVRVETVGSHNILYTAERIDHSGTMPTYHPLEAFMLPIDYPCRLSPVEPGKGFAGSGDAGLAVGPSDAKAE